MAAQKLHQQSILYFPSLYRPNTSILKNTSRIQQNTAEEEMCNCHELNNDQDLVINPYINYSYLSHSRNNSPMKNYYHVRQEPIYQNQLEVKNNLSQNYPIYSVVQKKNVRIMEENDAVSEVNTENTEENTETDTESNCGENVRLSPSNAYLEVSFEHNVVTDSIYSTPKRITKENVVTSTPSNKVRTITQV